MFELTVIRCPRKELIKLSCHYIFTSLSHHIIIRLTHVNVWESVGKPCSGMQFIKSIPSSCVRVRIRYYKSHVLHLNMQWKRRFIWWNQLLLALLLVLCTHNNTDRNKFVIFSGIALYYGDTYILSNTLCVMIVDMFGWYVLNHCVSFLDSSHVYGARVLCWGPSGNAG